MPANFLHGVETIEYDRGPVPIRGVKTAVIGLVGSAPMLDVASANRTLNEVKIIANPRDARTYFGEVRSGFTIPSALDAVFDQGNGPICLVVNVCDPASDGPHVVAVTNEEILIHTTTRKATLAHQQLMDVVVKDVTGVFTRSGTIATASGTLTSDGTAPSDGDTVTVAGKTYTFKTTLSTGPTVANQVKIGSSALTAMSNLKSAINGTFGIGTIYSIGTLQHTTVKATTLTTDATPELTLVAMSVGADGNSLATTESSTHLSFGAATLTGGVDQDYELDAANGTIRQIVGGNLIDGDLVTYKWLDPSRVQNSEVIGGVNDDDERIGMQALLDAYQLFGFFPKLLIAPGWSTLQAVTSEMIVLASKIRAMALIDAPIGTTFQEAIEGRGPEGTIAFDTSSDRAILCFPHVKVYDTDTDTEKLEPLSPRLAGRFGATDQAKGYWWSASNQEILGITGAEIKLTSMINDPTTETNLLNEAGIVTVFNAFGTGIRTWGNRSAAWPTVTSPRNFINVRRVADILHESIEYSMLQFIDQPISDALIDAITESVNMFMRTLIMRGALIDGRCSWDKAKNPYTEIALGHLTFDLEFMPPPPLERITFESYIDIKMLQALTGTLGSTGATG